MRLTTIALALLVFAGGAFAQQSGPPYSPKSEGQEDRVNTDEAIRGLFLGAPSMTPYWIGEDGATFEDSFQVQVTKPNGVTVPINYLLVTCLDPTVAGFTPLEIRAYVANDSFDFWFPGPPALLALPSFIPDRWVGPTLIPLRADACKIKVDPTGGGAWSVWAYSAEK